MKKLLFLALVIFSACGSGGIKQQTNKTAPDMHNTPEVRLITVDPGHFHAALVQKKMYDQVSPDVHVYAPEGTDCQQHIARINAYNHRPADPTSWNEIVYNGPDFFERMLKEKPGNVVILAGDNRKKAEYISRSVEAGLNVLSDKPMIIRPEDFQLLENAFSTAAKNGVLLYDIMTERFEVTTILQKMLSQNPDLFGSLEKGTKDEPAVSKISVHHFSKLVSGSPLQRPAWYFDVDQQGEGIVDVTTHLVDLVQWECFPEKILNPSDVDMISARRWPTTITREEFSQVTGLNDFPDFLRKDVKDGKLNVFANGEINYKLKGVSVKVSVEWRYQAPPGGGDTHYSVMHGTKCDLIIKQGAEEKYLPTLYVVNSTGKGMNEFRTMLESAIKSLPYDSIMAVPDKNNTFRIRIPARYRVSHEEHFGQVTAHYLDYLKAGKLPGWEVPGMLTKYYTTTSALKLARESK